VVINSPVDLEVIECPGPVTTMAGKGHGKKKFSIDISAGIDKIGLFVTCE
jgi:hypothetical protein